MKTIRQAVVAARDLPRVESELCRVLGLEIAYRDPAVGFFGLVNAVMPVGTTFLEVVSPVRPNAPAERFLQRRGRDAGYMVLIQTNDLAADRRRVEELGIRVVWSVDLDDISAMHLHPHDTGGAILSIDEPRPRDAWRWGGPDWKRAVRTEIVDAVVGIEFAAHDPAALSQRWAQILGRELAEGGDHAYSIELDGSRLLFVESREGEQEGLAAIELRARNPESALASAEGLGLPIEGATRSPAIVMGGTRFRLV